MKREYLKPEVFSKEQLNLNEAVAASCRIIPINKYQDTSQRLIGEGDIAEDYSNYGYDTKYNAYNTRYVGAGDAGSIDFGVVGPIYKIIYQDEGVYESFFWEDFNDNGVYDTIYNCWNDVESYLSTTDPRVRNSYFTGISDNFQSVTGGTFQPSAQMIGPTGKVVHS